MQVNNEEELSKAIMNDEAEISIPTATINNTAKTIRTVSETGNHKEAINNGNTIQEYQEILANIWDNVLQSCAFFSTLTAKKPAIHFTNKIAIKIQKNTQTDIIRAWVVNVRFSSKRKEIYSIGKY